MATRTTTQTSTRRRTRKATPKGETPDTQPLDSEGKKNPETTADDTAPKEQENPDTNSEGQETPPVDTASKEQESKQETPTQTGMDGEDFDPRKAELLDELFRITNQHQEKERRSEWNSQTRFIFAMTDDELDAFEAEIIKERDLKQMETKDFGVLQDMISEIIGNKGESGDSGQ